MQGKQQKRRNEFIRHLKQDAERATTMDREQLERLVVVGRIYGSGDRTFDSLVSAGLATGSGGWYFPTEKGIETIKPYRKWLRYMKWVGSLFLAAFIALVAQTFLERVVF